MRKRLNVTTLCKRAMVLAGVIGGLQAQQLEQRIPIRLIAEAEDFTVRRGWQIVPYRENYYASTFAISFLSRMACLGAPEQLREGEVAVAEQVVEVPYGDSFELLVRYEQPFNFSAEFTVEVEQNRQVVARFSCGRLDDPKYWAFVREAVPMERYWWGGTDNIVWQNPGAVKLEKGKATLRLLAAAQREGDRLRMNAARRHLDVVVLTNDREGMEAQKKAGYLPFDGWLVQDGDIFVRVENKGTAPIVPLLQPYVSGQHSPYYVHVRDWGAIRVLNKGYVEEMVSYALEGPRRRATSARTLAPRLNAASYWTVPDGARPGTRPRFAAPEGERLPPGQISGWVPIGQMLDALHDSKWRIQTDGPVELEFGVPDGKGGIRSVKKTVVEKEETFEIPGNIAPNPGLAKILSDRWWLPQIRTQREALVWLREQVEKFPKVGKRPERLLIYNIGGFGGTPNTPEGQALMAALGDNTMGELFNGKKRRLVAHWRDTRPEFYEKQNLDDVLIVSYGDEVHLPTAPMGNEEFAGWLKNRGVAADGPVVWTNDRSSPLYYYAKVAAVEKGAESFVKATAFYRSKGAWTGVNYSPHANYLVTDVHYVMPFKLNALSMAWSEDYVWQIPEFSVQVVGYLVTAFRCGVKYHGQPIQMYVMPHSPGNTPANFRRSFYTCLAHGTTIFNYFCASPLATGGTENYVATSDLGMWREIHRCTHEAGIFEDYVMDARVRPAQVGLLLSKTDEIWAGVANSTLAMHNNERKAVYYALRHAQIPVDMITEEDLIEGRAGGMRLIYVTQQWMHSRAAEALKRWVEEGGTLVAFCGGGFRDEYNRPSLIAESLYGVQCGEITTDPNLVSRYLKKENTPFLTKQDLPLYEPIGTVSWALPERGEGAKAEGVPVIVWRQTLRPTDAQVIGTFEDGAPAVAWKRHGKGNIYLFAFLPGQAYLKSGLPVRPADRGGTDAAFTHYLPTGMDRALRARLTEDFLPSDFRRPVQCDREYVESSCLDTLGSPNGGMRRMAVPLINYSAMRHEALTVRIEGAALARTARSVQHEAIQTKTDGKDLLVTLPLDVADVVLIDFEANEGRR